MMESAPTTEAVYQGVYTLYNNSNTVEQEKASKWLEQLQNSVSFSDNVQLFFRKSISNWAEFQFEPHKNYLDRKTKNITTL